MPVLMHINSRSFTNLNNNKVASDFLKGSFGGVSMPRSAAYHPSGLVRSGGREVSLPSRKWVQNFWSWQRFKFHFFLIYSGMVILFMVILVILWDSKLPTFESPIMVMFGIWCFFQNILCLVRLKENQTNKLMGNKRGVTQSNWEQSWNRFQ